MIKDPENTANHITEWLKDYAESAKVEGFVVGVSGGIDSALTSALCAMTGLPLTMISMPINQAVDQHSRSMKHMEWVESKFDNVSTSHEIDLTPQFDSYNNIINSERFPEGAKVKLALTNTASRVRAVCLYMFANANNLLVAGTGNKVEDFGTGFFTKFGDGAVDLSPIADLTKTEVRSLARHLGIIDDIITATPTDGLWEDNRSDEEQLGATYEELEEAMAYHSSLDPERSEAMMKSIAREDLGDGREYEVFTIYLTRHNRNAHKMKSPPTCIIPEVKGFVKYGEENL